MLFEDPHHNGVICYLDVFEMEVGFYGNNAKLPKRKWKKLVPPKSPGRPRIKSRKTRGK